jgi:hypothetical protein
MRLNSTGKNPCGPLAGIRDRDRRPCEGFSKASATQPVVSARAASRLCRGADVRSAWSINRPDTFCAMPWRGSAFLPCGCAMISCSVGKRGGLVFVPRVAGRSTPMTGTDRFNFSYSTIVIFFVLLGAPIAARSATLDDSAKELAGKIAAAVPVGESTSIILRNISSLPPDEFASVEQLLKAELENLKVRATTTGPITVNLRITLSENTKGLLWSAEITHGDSSQAIIMAVPRASETQIASYLMPIVLRGKIIWEGPEQILDAATTSEVGGLTHLLLLLPDGLAIQDIPGSAMSTVKFPSTGTAARDPRGSLEFSGNVASAVFPFRVCTIHLEGLQLMECYPSETRDLSRDADPADVEPHDHLIPGKGTEMLMPQNGCGAILATSSSDYTKPDWVQAFSAKPLGMAISNKLDFPGPVTALRGDSGVSRAIVRNLKTGNYEAYSLSCGN